MTRGGHPSLADGIGAAVFLSATGAALLAGLLLFASAAAGLRLTVAAVGFAYLLYLLARSGERTGRLTTVALWAIASIVLWLMGPALPAYVAAHIAVLWLVRALYFHSSLLTAIADLGVALLGAVFAAWAALRSGSALLAFWCFFLVQAFSALIPPALRSAATRAEGPELHGEDGTRYDPTTFERAHRAAEAALRRLAVHR